MKIYIDYIFIENYIVTFLCLYEVKIFTEKMANIKRMLLASMLSSGYVIVMIWLRLDVLNFIIAKLLISLIIIYISFKPEKIKEQLRCAVIYWITCIFNLGAIYGMQNLLNIYEVTPKTKMLIYVLGFGTSYIFVQGIRIMAINKQIDKQYQYKVIMNILGESFQFNAFLDTGNRIFCYLKKLPVIFALMPSALQKQDIDKLEKIKINVETINGKSVEDGYVIENIKIIKTNCIINKPAVVVFKNDKTFENKKYNMILNSKIE